MPVVACVVSLLAAVFLPAFFDELSEGRRLRAWSRYSDSKVRTGGGGIGVGGCYCYCWV